MSNKKNSFSAKGYYIALVLCAAAIGVSGYLYYRGANKTQADAPAAVTQQKDVPAAVTRPVVPDTTTAPAEATQETTAPKKPLKTASPLEGEVVAEYAMECLSYNQTTRDWRVHAGMDLAAETESQKPVFTIKQEAGKHSIEIRNIGEGCINVDAFEIL